jgi:hypothetical protein
MAQRQTDNSMTMAILRVWLWAVPVVMLLAAAVFGVIAGADGRWGLVGVMVVMGLIAVGLMVLHYWALYRFGKGADE